MPDNPLLAAALAYAAAGWSVFPCVPGGKAPLGKLVPHGVKDATTDEATIRAWWAAVPTANVAVATGRSNLIVVDCEGPEGIAVFINWADAHDVALADVPCATTPRTQGRHYYFRAAAPPDLERGPTSFVMFNDAGKGIVEIRNNESYVIAPPSTFYEKA